MAGDLKSDKIEREIEEERVALARSLEDLQRQLAPDALVERASTAIRENGGDLAGIALRHAKDNPLAVALTGAGLAWLLAGPAKKTHDPEDIRNARIDYDDRDYPTVPGFRHAPADESFEARVARAEGETYDPAVRADAVPGTGSVPKPERGEQSLRDRLMEGTEMMTEAARDRVMAAREAAIEAERRLEARARDYGAAGRDAYYSQPLLGALVAFGVGAAVGALLPRTRTEDRHLGAARDRALLEAERVYRAEAAKLRAQAESIAEDALTSAADALKDRVSDATSSATTTGSRRANGSAKGAGSIN